MGREGAAALPAIAAQGLRRLAERLLGAAAGAAAGDTSAEVYRRLGVRPFINARGTWTYLSGSLPLPEVRRAMDAAARHFVDMFELQEAAGRKLAELSGAESGMVTSGAAAAMAAGAAACIAGADPAAIWRLPDTTGLKNEVVMLGGRTAFDSALRLTGARLVVAEELADLAAAIGPRTAMVYTTWGDERVEGALPVTRARGVPFMVDDAAGIPPFDSMRRFAELKVDLYCFSGGKGLRGPQCAGVLLGRKDLIDAARRHCSPWEGAVCRPMKVGKEEIVGVLTAIETWQRLDLEKLNRTWRARVETIASMLETVPGVTTRIVVPEAGNRYPTLEVFWDEGAFAFGVADCDRELRTGEPRIEVLTESNPSVVSGTAADTAPDVSALAKGARDRIRIVSMTLQDGEERIVGRRLREILNGARRRAQAEG
jgi:L-seryl-tRNA(Ser) seleniumtransferase